MYLHKISILVFSLFLIAIVALTIYLTPLKHFNLVEPTIDDISPTDFYELYQANPDKYVFLDVRNEFAYNSLHAAGSDLLPLHNLYTERLFLPKNTDQTIVMICSGGVASGVGYHYLEHHGFFNIMRIEGGIEAWQDAGLPVASSQSNL